MKDALVEELKKHGLEEEVGCALAERSNGNVYLTVGGDEDDFAERPG